MNRPVFNGEMLKEMLLMGAAMLEHNKASIDAMNVFPVPDGDTGTNMSMTMQRAAKEVHLCSNVTVEDVSAAASLGALKGARGNSGVILSQIFRGFASALKGKGDVVTARMLADAMRAGTEAAYKAVMRPKEGTMLTVVRAMADSAARAAAVKDADVYEVFEAMLKGGEEALKKTPELLPVLKEAGVLDSGGTGLLTIYRGFLLAADGEEPDDIGFDTEDQLAAPPEAELTLQDVNEIRFGYCTELFIIHIRDDVTEEDINHFRDKLVKLGDSVVVVSDSGIIKVHVHSNAPGKVIQFALRLGEIDKLKVDNMRQQNRELAEQLKLSEKEQGIVAVSVGSGLDNIFKELGVDAIISGGQTMNPSIDVIAQAVKRANARNVFVLPNNSNIILAAKQAAEISDRNVIVLPTTTVMQGIAAMMGFSSELSLEDNEDGMKECASAVVSGSVTYSVRDTSYNGNTIAQGDMIGLMDNNISTVMPDVASCADDLIRRMIEKRGDCGLVTVYYGENVAPEDANALVEKLQADYPDIEFMVQYGGQPIYFYYMSAE